MEAYIGLFITLAVVGAIYFIFNEVKLAAATKQVNGLILDYKNHKWKWDYIVNEVNQYNSYTPERRTVLCYDVNWLDCQYKDLRILKQKMYKIVDEINELLEEIGKPLIAKEYLEI